MLHPRSLKAGLIALVFAASPCSSARAQDRDDAQSLVVARKVGQLVSDECRACHTRGRGAPFAFDDYRDLAKRARQIAEVTASGFMPPWLPEPGHGDFIGGRRLNADEIALFQKWSASGGRVPDGALPAAQAQVAVRAVDGTPPDVILEQREATIVPAESLGLIHTFVLRLPEDSPRFLRAIDFRPSEPRVVHGAAFLLDGSGSAKMLDDATAESGYRDMGSVGEQLSGAAGGWSVGREAIPLPKGYGWPIARERCDLSIQMHLNSIGKPTPLTAKAGLYFSKEETVHAVTAVAIGSLVIDIAPGDEDYEIVCDYRCPVDVDLVGVQPIAHFLCQEIQLRATLPSTSPDEKVSRDLLWIRDWDVNWAQPYLYRKTMPLPRDTQIRVRFRFDNSPSNLQNPSSPPRRVRLGRPPLHEHAFVQLLVAPRRAEDFDRLRESHREEMRKRIDLRRRSGL